MLTLVYFVHLYFGFTLYICLRWLYFVTCLLGFHFVHAYFAHIYFGFTLYICLLWLHFVHMFTMAYFAHDYFGFTLHMFFPLSCLHWFHFVDVYLLIAGNNQSTIYGSETDGCWLSILVWKF